MKGYFSVGSIIWAGNSIPVNSIKMFILDNIITYYDRLIYAQNT